MIERLVTNLGGKRVRTRREMLDGRPHLVVPTVMGVRGVWNGSSGPLLYDDDELGRNPQAWDHRPIVVYHPQDENGDGMTAADPGVIDKQRVGITLYSDFGNHKLKTESWLDIEKCNEVDDRIIPAIEAGKTLNVSTGLYTTNDMKEGEFEGKPYKGVAREHVPDHLAILPDKKGACSVEAGAGLLQNEDKSKNPLTNDVSYSSISEQVTCLICESLMVEEDSYPRPYISDVYADYVVYSWAGKYYRQGYSVSDDVVSLDGEPEQVYAQAVYKAVANNEVIANSSIFERETTMAKTPARKELVDKIIANSNGAYDEADREMLSKMPEAKFGKLAALLEPKKEVAPIENEEDDEEEEDDTPTPVTNKKKYGKGGKKPVANAEEPTDEEWLSKLPPKARSAVQNAMQVESEAKEKLIKKIVANKKNRFTPEFLDKKQVKELQGIVDLMAPQRMVDNDDSDDDDDDDEDGTPMFLGQGGSAPIENEEGDDAEEGNFLEIPQLTWNEDEVDDVIHNRKSSKKKKKVS